jgi:cysteine-rich repeat protein
MHQQVGWHGSRFSYMLFSCSFSHIEFCTLIFQFSCMNAVCGDGYVLEGVEDCDDGNTNDGDGCSSTCHIVLAGSEASVPTAVGVNPKAPVLLVDTRLCYGRLAASTIECQDMNTSNEDGCTNLCKWNVCGDGYLFGGQEECDDGNVAAGDGCSSECKIEPVCGNGIVQVGEACDDSNTSNNDACLSSCVVAVCGDGYVYIGKEACDDGNTDNGDGCSSTCKLESICGNKIVEGNEQCDDGNNSNDDACSNR